MCDFNKRDFFIVQTETIVTSDDSTFFFVVTFKKHSQITRVTSDSETPGRHPIGKCGAVGAFSWGTLIMSYGQLCVLVTVAVHYLLNKRAICSGR